MQRQGSRYDRETKAQALALVAAQTVAHAARELSVPETTIRRWVRHYTEENGGEQWADDNAQVISRATELTLDGLDQVEEQGTAHKHLIALNAIRGTAIDKASKHSGSTVNIIALVQTRAAEIQATIEGEYRLLDDED